MVKILVKYGAGKFINTINFSPLFVACINENKEIMQYLIDNGADINQIVDELGSTILHYACMDENLDLVKFIIENGC
ncbi:MAG: hypothetical protein ACD_82C00009G0001, partial [uncultured bacterium]